MNNAHATSCPRATSSAPTCVCQTRYRASRVEFPIPTSCVFSTMNAGLKRANDRIAATETAHHNGSASRVRSVRLMGKCRSCGTCLHGGSLTPKYSTATDAKPGMAATQNTSRKSSPLKRIRPIAMSGPATAPIVYSANRKPKPAPRILLGVTSVSSASRGASRMPLPMRSTTRANKTADAAPASGKSNLFTADKP